MLNRAERRKILKIIQICCIIGCFPVTVDLCTWQLLSKPKTGKQRWPNVAYSTGFLFQVIYKFATFLRACFLHKIVPLHELTIHSIMVLGGLVVLLWYYLMFIQHSGAFRAYLQMTLLGNIGGPLFKDKGTTKWSDRLKEYTVREWIAISLPYMVAAVVPAYFLTAVYYPNLQHFLYAGLPESCQTWLSFNVLLIEEIRYMATFCVVAVPMWTLQLISFDLVNTRLKLLIHSIERATKYRQLDLIYSYLRHFQLYVSIINEVNRYLIFSWKVYSITICIATGYAAIAHFTDHPLFGVLFYIMLIDCTFIYTVIYGKAFKTPELFEEATQKTLLRLHRSGYRDMHILKRKMLSVPRVGIKVGEFHMMERQSVLIFMHYVLSNIATMLVAYKH